MLENLEGTPAEELRLILHNLSPTAEAAEQSFVERLHLMRRDLEGAGGAELAAASDGAQGEPALRGLISEARKCGLTAAELADAAQLSVVLMTKLDLRRIRYASIPRQVIEEVARALTRSAEQVALYLQGGPIRTAAVFSAVDAPEDPGGPQDFLDAVHTDASLSAERRARLSGMMSQ